MGVIYLQTFSGYDMDAEMYSPEFDWPKISGECLVLIGLERDASALVELADMALKYKPTDLQIWIADTGNVVNVLADGEKWITPMPAPFPVNEVREGVCRLLR